MIKQINKIFQSKESSDKKEYELKILLNKILKETKKFNENFFGEILIEYKEGEISNIKTIDRYQDKKLLELNKKVYKDLIIKLLSPIDLLKKIDNYTNKEINRLNKRNKSIADWYYSRVLETEVDTTNLNKETFFLEKRFVHKEEKEKNRQVVFSSYIENISVKYLSFLSKNPLIEKINIIIKSGQSDNVEQVVNCFPEAIVPRQQNRDIYDNNVIEKQNYEKLTKIQPREFIFNCEIEILLNKKLTEYEEIVFLSDLKTNGIIGTFDRIEKNEAPIKLTDLYAVLMKSN